MGGRAVPAERGARPTCNNRWVTEEIIVPRFGPTNRIVELPAMHLSDAITGAAPELSTAVRLAVRRDVLLVRFDARHRGIVATLEEDDAPLWTEDVVEIFIAVEEPPLSYFEFEMNPLGARFSARVTSPTGTRDGMEVAPFRCAGLSSEARVRERVWSVMVRIPLASLSLPPARETFRANCFRIDRTSGQFSALFPTGAAPPDFHVVRAFGNFRISTGTGLE